MKLKNHDMVLAYAIGIAYYDVFFSRLDSNSKAVLAGFAQQEIASDYSPVFDKESALEAIGLKLQYRYLAEQLGLSLSEISKSIKRLKDANLVAVSPVEHLPLVMNTSAAVEWALASMKYANKPDGKGVGIGLPTAWHNPLIQHEIVPRDIPMVIAGQASPSQVKPVQGEVLEPIYKHAAIAVANSTLLYQLFSVFDMIRTAKPRELVIAEKHLQILTRNIRYAQQLLL